MSRIGKYPVNIPSGVEVKIGDGEVMAKGPLGSLAQRVSKLVNVRRDGDTLVFEPADDSSAANAMSGTVRALVGNLVAGVNTGFERKLTLVGVGYRAQAQGDKLNLSLGFSHPVVHQMPKGIKVETPQ
jgi:large subunit ribosomal protein L6